MKAVVVFVAMVACARAAEPDAIRAAVTKAIPLIEAGARGSMEERDQCFTCHNQGLPIMALTTARSRGFAIDEKNLNAQVKFTADFLAKNREKYLAGIGQGGKADTAGYALWALANGGWKSDETTTAVVEFITGTQRDLVHWKPQSQRPPTEQSLFTSTHVALRGMKTFGTPEQRERIDQRIAAVREWLRTAKAKDTEDRVSRLRALHVIGEDTTSAAKELLDTQREDGGWAQLADMMSDAYATATALTALHQAGGLATTDAPYQRGLDFLLAAQLPDGSWHVRTRSKPIQRYYESGYPHGKDQFISITAAGWATTALALALPERRTAAMDFVRDVQPIFAKHCNECHGEKKQKSGLRLDVKAAAMKGGDEHGASIVAGKAKESPLIELVTSTDKDERMPPKGEPLSAAEIATLTRWIEEGAVWPDGVDAVKLADLRDHWAFKPLYGVPALAGPPEGGPPYKPAKAGTPNNSIDSFIKAASPEADRVAWLRRVYFDLIGLPPTPEQVAAFVNDGKRERVVDELLASPRYGERWAQHWLDVVRYADTHGFEVNTERPNAWPYRDYVIRAFNDDVPYDRFIREQIAGDAFGADAATGFLVTASVLLPGQIGKDEPSKRLARQDSLDEIVMNIGQTFLGLSVGCARCHDHKFDPIPQRDYYAMQAFIAGVEYEERELHTPEADAARAEAKKFKAQIVEIEKQLARFVPLAKSGAERPAVNARVNTDRFAPVKAKRVRFTIRATNNLEPCIDELEVFDTAGENVARDAAVTSSGDTTVADRHELRFVNDGNYGNSRSWMSNEKGRGWVALEFAHERQIERIVWGRDREGKFKDRLATSYVIEVASESGEWKTVADSTDRAKEPSDEKFSTKGLSAAEAKEANRLLAQKKPIEMQLAAAENAQKAFAGKFRAPDEIHLLSRGDPEQPKDEVLPAVLSALGDTKLPKQTAEQQRRLALADWIASPQNPLTARVMVNRIWQGHFGTGIVETPSDFGHSGAKPTNPALLDWLASEFIHSGWSVKHMHRLIVLSAEYRQQREPRRLDAEVIRDSMLAVSGRLNLKMYGRGFDLFDKRGGLSGFTPVESFSGDGLRRMIYAHKVRREREAIFGAFDCPDAGQSTARRRESTTPIQALNLFNSRFTLEQAEALAARAGGDIRRAYQLALSREPTAEELADAESIVRTHGLAPLCRAIFNSNEFLFTP